MSSGVWITSIELPELLLGIVGLLVKPLPDIIGAAGIGVLDWVLVGLESIVIGLLTG